MLAPNFYANPAKLRMLIAACPKGVVVDSERFKALGESLMQQHRVAEAADAFAQAAVLAPRDEGAFIRLGIAHSVLGQGALALEAYDRALVLNPHSVPAYYNRSGLKRYQAGDAELQVLSRLLEDTPSMPLDERIMAHFTLGKAGLDLGDGDLAFLHFNLGNGLMRRTVSFDIAASIAQMERIAEILTPDRIAALKVGGNPSVQPIFVVGMPRSGSTLVEQILASHGAVAGGGEISAFRTLLQNLRHNHGEVIAYPHVVTLLSPQVIGQIGAGYVHLTKPWAQAGKTRLVDKLLENFLYAGLIHAALPQAKIIHCQRDARDTCLSCYTMLFNDAQSFTFDMTELGRYWRAYDRLMAHWRVVLPPQNFIEVGYEDLVTSFEPTTRSLLTRLDLPWDAACLSFYQNPRPVLTASSQQVRQPVHTGSQGRWKHYASYLTPLLRALHQD